MFARTDRLACAATMTFAVTCILAPGAAADLVLSEWIGGVNNNWGTAGNWNPATVPNNGGGDTYAVTVHDGSGGNIIAINMSPTIDSLSVLGSTFLSLNNNLTLTVRTGPIHNEGALRLNAGGNLSRLQIGTPFGGDVVALTGGGLVIMTPTLNNRISGVVDTNRLVNVNNLIRGSGLIGENAMLFTNHGIVRANDILAELRIDPRAGNNGVINTGVFEATNEGALRLQGGNYNNTEGVIRSTEGSLVYLENATITGGQMEVQAGSGTRTVTNDTISLLDNLMVHVHDGGELRVNNRTELRLGSDGTYLNEGTIHLNGGGNHCYLRPVGSGVILEGGGVLSMSASLNNVIWGLTPTDHLINVDNLIRGGGQIGANQMRFTNHGVVRADEILSELRIDPSTGSNGVINTGVFEATNEGALRLQGGNYNNTEGVIRSTEGSFVYLENATITGGQMEVQAGSGTQTVTNNTTSSLDNLMLHVQNGGELRVNNATELRLGSGGTYLNEGTIRLNGGGNHCYLWIVGPEATLTGGGVLSMSATLNNAIRGDAHISRLTNTDLLIRGSGQVGLNELGITNHGTFDADQVVVMRIDPSDVLGFENHGTLRASLLGGMEILAGPFVTTGQVIVEPVSKITRVGAYTQTAGITTVNGDLQVNNGTFQLQGGTLNGDGLVIAPVSNTGGVVRPGSAGSGTLSVTGSYTQAAGGTFNVRIDGNGASRLDVSTTATLAGTLHVEQGSCAGVPAGTEFVILTAGTLVGAFDSIIADEMVEVEYAPRSGEIVLRFMGGCTLGDLNCDGIINGADLGLLLGAWGPCADPEGCCAADLNGDGVVNGADLGLLLGAWGG